MQAVSTSLNFPTVSKPFKWLWVSWHFAVSSKATALGVSSLKINKSQLSWQTWSEDHQAHSLTSKLVSWIVSNQCLWGDQPQLFQATYFSALLSARNFFLLPIPALPDRCQPILPNTGIILSQPSSLDFDTSACMLTNHSSFRFLKDLFHHFCRFFGLSTWCISFIIQRWEPELQLNFTHLT